MKYYCPRKWYQNTECAVPCNGRVNIQFAFSCGGETMFAEYADVWSWTANIGNGAIKYFRVLERTPMLVENPSVSLHEVLNERTG